MGNAEYMGVEHKTSFGQHLSTQSKMADNELQLSEEVNTVVEKTEELVIEDVSDEVATNNEETENVSENKNITENKVNETETAASAESETTEEAATEVGTEETVIDEKVEIEEGTEKETETSPSEPEIMPEEKAQ